MGVVLSRGSTRRGRACEYSGLRDEDERSRSRLSGLNGFDRVEAEVRLARAPGVTQHAASFETRRRGRFDRGERKRCRSVRPVVGRHGRGRVGVVLMTRARAPEAEILPPAARVAAVSPECSLEERAGRTRCKSEDENESENAAHDDPV